MFKKIHYARTSPSLALQLQQMPVLDESSKTNNQHLSCITV